MRIPSLLFMIAPRLAFPCMLHHLKQDVVQQSMDKPSCNMPAGIAPAEVKSTERKHSYAPCVPCRDEEKRLD